MLQSINCWLRTLSCMLISTTHICCSNCSATLSHGRANILTGQDILSSFGVSWEKVRLGGSQNMLYVIWRIVYVWISGWIEAIEYTVRWKARSLTRQVQEWGLPFFETTYTVCIYYALITYPLQFSDTLLPHSFAPFKYPLSCHTAEWGAC